MEDLQYRYKKASELIDKTIEFYFQDDSCACKYPRFLQIVGIDCMDYKETFKAWETTLFLNKVKKYFIVKSLESGKESSNEKWTCKKCNSTYNFGWSEFSIAVEREFLKPIDLKPSKNGLLALKPIPLYVGLYGYSYPSSNEIESVDFESFEKYILEK